MKKKTFWSRIKAFIGRFFSPTPRKWKQIRNTAAGLLAGVVGLGGLSATIPSITTPQWFTDYGWYIGAVLTVIIAYAQSKEEKK